MKLPEPEPETAEEQEREEAEEQEAMREQESVAPPSPPPPVAPRTDMRTIPAAPTVRRFAREVGVDLSTVKGSGPGGRISIDDVKAEANRLLSSGGATAGVAPAQRGW